MFFYLMWHFSFLTPLCPSVSRQAEGAGGDQELHHPVSGQRRLLDQHVGQQCATDAGHPGVAAPPHGVLHQPHLAGTNDSHVNSNIGRLLQMFLEVS